MIFFTHSYLLFLIFFILYIILYLLLLFFYFTFLFSFSFLSLIPILAYPPYPYTSTSQDNPLPPLFFLSLFFSQFFSFYFFLLPYCQLPNSTPTRTPIFSKANQPFTSDTVSNVTPIPFSMTPFHSLIFSFPHFLTSPIFVFYYSFYIIHFFFPSTPLPTYCC